MNATRRAATGKYRANLVDRCYWKQSKDEKTTALYRMPGVDRTGRFAVGDRSCTTCNKTLLDFSYVHKPCINSSNILTEISEPWQMKSIDRESQLQFYTASRQHQFIDH